MEDKAVEAQVLLLATVSLSKSGWSKELRTSISIQKIYSMSEFSTTEIERLLEEMRRPDVPKQ